MIFVEGLQKVYSFWMISVFVPFGIYSILDLHTLLPLVMGYRDQYQFMMRDNSTISQFGQILALLFFGPLLGCKTLTVCHFLIFTFIFIGDYQPYCNLDTQAFRWSRSLAQWIWQQLAFRIVHK